MYSYSDHDVEKKLASLNSDIDLLITLCASKETNFIGFNITGVTKEQEQDAIAEQREHIPVEALSQWFHIHHVLRGWKSFYKDPAFSTFFVDRYPGLVVPSDNHQQIAQLVKKINLDKHEFAKMIRSGRTTPQRHEYIHALFPQIMTDHVYRKIHVIDTTVTNAWFNWTTRNVPKTYTQEQAEKFLKQQKSKPRFMFDSNDWGSLMDALINEVNSGVYKKFQQYKAYKQIPVVEMQTTDSNGIKKRKKLTITTPLILLNQPGLVLPKVTPLNDYIAKEHHGGISRLASNKVVLDRHLKFIGVK